MQGVRDSGLPVELRREGEGPERCPPAVDLAAYRIVQEALTNALKHARRRRRAWSGRATAPTPSSSRSTTTGAGRRATAAATGTAWSGMRERVALCGGELDAGPRAGGGFAVRARAPARTAGVMIRVLLADDQALVRAGFRMILEAAAGHRGGRRGERRPRGGRRWRAELRPDVVLMDVRMPRARRHRGDAAAARASPHAPRVLVLTTFDLDEYVYEALRAGASGFLLKAARPEQLADAVRTVAAGDALLAPTITRRLIEEFVRGPQPGARAPDRSRRSPSASSRCSS